MKPASLHLRLLLGGGIATLAALAVAWLAMTWLFGRHVDRREATELSRQGMALVGALHGPAPPLALDDHPQDPRFQIPSSGLYWQVLGDGAALRSRSLWDQSLPNVASRSQDWTLSKVDGPFGRRLLVVARKIEFDGVPAQIAVATDVAPQAAAQAEFARELAGFMAVLWVFLTAAAFMQVRLGLSPLSALRLDLERMKRSVTERLPKARASELSPLVAAINDLADSREADIQRARRRAADLAHSLKTPLAALAAQARQARAQGATEAADGLDLSIDMVAATLEAELARARAAAVRDKGPPGVSRPASVAERLVAVLERTEDGERILMDVDIEPSLTVSVEEPILMEVLGPILENGARYARRRLSVSGARSADGAVSIHIDDDGHGLAMERAGAALMRGGRLDEAGPGHGLGLAIARDLVEATKGRMTLGPSSLGGLRVSLIWAA